MSIISIKFPVQMKNIFSLHKKVKLEKKEMYYNFRKNFNIFFGVLFYNKSWSGNCSFWFY
ncbi:MAG: hypothetical protein A2Y71_03665 [Bacteroidetes bacterium RBG_13_42_15]|nr:MAG: hypothetical protein A2Y71_03665 [Bacteroidetes bacterium RBG_13_42_15]